MSTPNFDASCFFRRCKGTTSLNRKQKSGKSPPTQWCVVWGCLLMPFPSPSSSGLSLLGQRRCFCILLLILYDKRQTTWGSLLVGPQVVWRFVLPPLPFTCPVARWLLMCARASLIQWLFPRNSILSGACSPVSLSASRLAADGCLPTRRPLSPQTCPD